MSELRFTKDHEWLRIEGSEATVGITAYAAEQLGDVVYVELPGAGKALVKAGEAAVVESVKAASEVYAPASGTVTAVNDALTADPAKVNADPLGEGWFFKMTLSAPGEVSSLMTQAQYTDYIKGL